MAKKILLADDSMTIQKVVSITFAAEDFDLVIVGDGNAAIEKVKDERPDLVMADIAMPGKTGYEVCEYIKNDPALKRIPVLLLAGTFEPLNPDEAARVKSDDNIIKPFESQALVDKVKLLIARGEAAGRVERTMKPVQEPRPAVSANVWEAGDFLGAPEEPVEAGVEAEPDLGFLEGGLVDDSVKEGAPAEAGFMDLDFTEEAKPIPTPQAPPKTVASPKPEAKPASTVPAAPLPEIDFSSFSAEPLSAPVEEESSFWMSPEAPQAPQTPVKTPAPPPYRPVPAPPIAPAPRPAAPVASVQPTIERVVEKVIAKAEVPVQEAFGNEALKAQISAIASKEELHEMVKKSVREIVEEIAWEVVPELAEELVLSEINRFKEALFKTKQKA
ncbi:MAG: response regulator [Deltaproteobacteria bacterium]|nr:response regulator [Deltaproteobacteria bacterium]